MATKLIGCETLRDEIELAMRETGAGHEVEWIESGLHNTPEKLRGRLQEALDAMDGRFERVLMAFGQCGNSLQQLETGGYEMIIPRVDDCITMLLGSMGRRHEVSEAGGTYFLTPGWLRGERNLWAEYEYAAAKYGAEMAKGIMESMLRNYKYLGILDTRSYDIESIRPETERIAAQLELEHKVIPATVGYLCDLLTGPWDDDARFVRVGPHTVLEEFRL